MSALQELCKKRIVLDWTPLNRLCSKYHSYIDSVKNNGSEHEESEKKYRDLLLELEVYKFSMKNMDLQATRNEKNLELAKKEVDDIENSKILLEEEFNKLTEKLDQVKEEHKQKLEYDTMASAILELENQETQSEKLQKLKEQCEILQDVNDKLVGKIDKRSKNFSLAFASLKMMENDYEEES